LQLPRDYTCGNLDTIIIFYLMYSLKYKVTTSTCDSNGRLKLFSALQMMQDCSEMWIDSEPTVKHYFAQQNMTQLLATRQVEVVRPCKGTA